MNLNNKSYQRFMAIHGMERDEESDLVREATSKSARERGWLFVDSDRWSNRRETELGTVLGQAVD